jgi:hypothetical protein
VFFKLIVRRAIALLLSLMAILVRTATACTSPMAVLMDVVDVDNDLETDKPYEDAVNQLKRVTGGSSPR